MKKLIFASVLSLFFTGLLQAQNESDQSGPDIHLIKKNLHVSGNFSSADGKDLVLQTNATTRITVLDQNGFVGIGVPNPLEFLHVNGSIRGNQAGGAVRIQTDYGYIDLGPQSSDGSWFSTELDKFIFNKGIFSGTGVFSSHNETNLVLATNGAGRIFVDRTSGNVGLGVEAPQENLHLSGAVRGHLEGGALQVSTEFGTLDLGASGGGTTSINTSLNSFSFNKPVGIDGSIERLNGQNLNILAGGENRVNILAANGFVGLGVETPEENLDVAGTMRLRGLSSEQALSKGLYVDDNGKVYSKTVDPGLLEVGFTINAGTLSLAGKSLGIGVTDTKGYLLAVGGQIVSEGVMLKLEESWPDYVFDAAYQLPSLDELSSYIEKEKHLPNVPSAEQVKDAGGFEVGQMNLVLLQKIEELTLYQLQLHETIKKQQEQIDMLVAKSKD